ncbi:SH3 domain containing YSC84-like protein 1 [Dissostichus eleginoides]|uniref:SH3 domain-containing YSC84-like protein 1 n=1 Tax=Dissostichus eleginoides TaxID=100907 RepID=A0AAD9B2X5_DISEL|nr:SH3 domain containing YSC84-like protein 1 [Dissostichus eleginoides]
MVPLSVRSELRADGQRNQTSPLWFLCPSAQRSERTDRGTRPHLYGSSVRPLSAQSGRTEEPDLTFMVPLSVRSALRADGQRNQTSPLWFLCPSAQSSERTDRGTRPHLYGPLSVRSALRADGQRNQTSPLWFLCPSAQSSERTDRGTRPHLYGSSVRPLSAQSGRTEEPDLTFMVPLSVRSALRADGQRNQTSPLWFLCPSAQRSERTDRGTRLTFMVPLSVRSELRADGQRNQTSPLCSSVRPLRAQSGQTAEETEETDLTFMVPLSSAQRSERTDRGTRPHLYGSSVRPLSAQSGRTEEPDLTFMVPLSVRSELRARLPPQEPDLTFMVPLSVRSELVCLLKQSLLNNPIPSNLKSEAKKAAKILRDFTEISNRTGLTDRLIPPHVIAKAEGLAIISVIKAGFMITARGGSGIVIARLGDRRWSAPSAIGIAGLGGGFEIGVEVCVPVDLLQVCVPVDLLQRRAVDAFTKGGNLTLGGNCTVAVGPVGDRKSHLWVIYLWVIYLWVIYLWFIYLWVIYLWVIYLWVIYQWVIYLWFIYLWVIYLNVEADVSIRSPAAVFTYCRSRGLFAGISLEGSGLIERKDTNRKFYGREIRASAILNGDVEPRPNATISTTSWTNTPTPTPPTGPARTCVPSRLVLHPDLQVHLSKDRHPDTNNNNQPDTNNQEDTNNNRQADTNNNNRPDTTNNNNNNNQPDTNNNNQADTNKRPDTNNNNRPDTNNNHQPDTTNNNNNNQPDTNNNNNNQLHTSRLQPPRIKTPCQLASRSPPHNGGGGASGELVVTATHPFTGQQPGDLSFVPGDSITVVTKTESQYDWWEGRHSDGRVGIFPANFVAF